MYFTVFKFVLVQVFVKILTNSESAAILYAYVYVLYVSLSCYAQM